MSNAKTARLTSAERKAAKAAAAEAQAKLEAEHAAQLEAERVAAEQAKAAQAPKLKQKTSSAGRDALDNGGARARAINAVIIERGAVGASVKEIQAACDAAHGAGAIKAIANHMLHLLKRNLVVRLSTGRYRLTDEVIAAIAPPAPPAAPPAAPEVKAPRKRKSK